MTPILILLALAIALLLYVWRAYQTPPQTYCSEDQFNDFLIKHRELKRHIETDDDFMSMGCDIVTYCTPQWIAVARAGYDVSPEGVRSGWWVTEARPS